MADCWLTVAVGWFDAIRRHWGLRSWQRAAETNWFACCQPLLHSHLHCRPRQL